jgi:hypothetical protein
MTPIPKTKGHKAFYRILEVLALVVVVAALVHILSLPKMNAGCFRHF